ncbi:MAG: hypothetical protein CVV61_08060, partial [Tenericutes bacterium HGW-Tenericutes-6]
MIFIFSITIFGSIFLAIFASSLLWKYEKRTYLGFIPVLSMIPIGFLMMIVYRNVQHSSLSAEQFVIIIYFSCLIYFSIQLLFVLHRVKRIKAKT